MTAFLIDEMFSPSAATLLRDKFGHDAVHVSEVGLQAAEDAVVAAAARAEGRVVVTENVADYAAGRRISLTRTWARTGPRYTRINGAVKAALCKASRRTSDV